MNASIPVVVETTPLQQESWVPVVDHTLTVDPARNSYWVRDGSNMTHISERRANDIDRREVERIRAWEDAQSAVETSTYIPTSADLARGQKHFPSRTHCDGYMTGSGARRTAERLGMLPVIEAQIRAGLPNKSMGEIEAEIRIDARRRASRVFERAY